MCANRYTGHLRRAIASDARRPTSDAGLRSLITASARDDASRTRVAIDGVSRYPVIARSQQRPAGIGAGRGQGERQGTACGLMLGAVVALGSGELMLLAATPSDGEVRAACLQAWALHAAIDSAMYPAKRLQQEESRHQRGSTWSPIFQTTSGSVWSSASRATCWRIRTRSASRAPISAVDTGVTGVTGTCPLRTPTYRRRVTAPLTLALGVHEYAVGYRGRKRVGAVTGIAPFRPLNPPSSKR